MYLLEMGSLRRVRTIFVITNRHIAIVCRIPSIGVLPITIISNYVP